jgi:hypothetical protein
MLRLFGGRRPYSLPLPQLISTLRAATAATGALVPAAGIGVLVGILGRGPNGMGWAYAMLILSAVVVAVVQQTLP